MRCCLHVGAVATDDSLGHFEFVLAQLTRLFNKKMQTSTPSAERFKIHLYIYYIHHHETEKHEHPGAKLKIISISIKQHCFNMPNAHHSRCQWRSGKCTSGQQNGDDDHHPSAMAIPLCIPSAWFEASPHITYCLPVKNSWPSSQNIFAALTSI